MRYVVLGQIKKIRKYEQVKTSEMNVIIYIYKLRKVTVNAKKLDRQV